MRLVTLSVRQRRRKWEKNGVEEKLIDEVHVFVFNLKLKFYLHLRFRKIFAMRET